MVFVKGKLFFSVRMILILILIQVVPGGLGDGGVGTTWKSPWEAIIQERCEEEVEGWGHHWGGQPEEIQGSGI